MTTPWAPPTPGTTSAIRGATGGGDLLTARRDGNQPRGDHHQDPTCAGKNDPYGLCTDADGVSWFRPRSGQYYKPATVRFYFDADVLGLAHQIASLHPDATYPRCSGWSSAETATAALPHHDPVHEGPIWVSQVTALGWLSGPTLAPRIP